MKNRYKYRIICFALLIGMALIWSSPSYGQNVRPLFAEVESGSITPVQTGTIIGKVTDASTGATLPGANVVIEGIQKGTATGVNGQYRIENVSPGSYTLVASFLGYKENSKDITIAADETLTVNFALQESAVGLEELVVVGYGTQERKELTGSVTTIKEEDFKETGGIIEPIQLIQGKVAGLQITRPSGMDPNAGTEIQLRGLSTLRAGAEPLIIVDGIPGGDLRNIASEDIKSIDVLRDGSAAAIYGARASNGVILITTKRGQASAPTFDYWGYVTTQQVTRKPRVLTAEEYVALAEEPDNPYSASMTDFGADTDWFTAMLNDYPVSQSHTLSMKGGTENTNYRVSVNYRDMQPIVMKTWRKEGRTRVNINHRGLNDRLTFQLDLSSTFATARYMTPDNYGGFQQSLKRNPTLPVKNPDGTFNEIEGWNTYNPVARQVQHERGDKWRYLNGGLKTTYSIQKNWDASVRVATTRDDNVGHQYIDRNAWALNQGQENTQVQDNVSTWGDSHIERLLESTTTYLFEHSGHRLRGMAGYSYQDFARERQSSSSSKLIAFFGRANYSFNDTYLLSASVRREGSSKFGENSKWGVFPAVSAGWRISEEPFMESIDIVDDLKLRIGYGVTGNQGIDPFLSKARIGGGGWYQVWNTNGYYQWIQTYGLSNNPNPNLRWEEKYEWNIGLDFTLLNDRLSGTIDLYDRTTKDLLFDYTAQIPPMIHDNIFANVGTMENKGIEVTLEASPVQSRDFSWKSTVTFSHNRNKLESLSNEVYKRSYQDTGWLTGPGSLGSSVRIQEEKPVGSFYGRKFAGFTEDGQWLFYNQNGEAVTDDQITEEDKQFLGNGLPKYFASWTNTFGYKNISLTLFLRGSFLFEILNMKEIYFGNKQFLPNNVLKSAITKHDQLNDKPQFSDYYLENGDYVKFDTITLAYNFSLSNAIVRNLRVYATGQNLVTITGYSGIDPEVERGGLTPGIDGVRYFPRSRSVSIGAKIGF